MIINGESFPSWFSPHYHPTEPIKPTEPNKVNLVEVEVHVEDIYVNTESPVSLSKRLEKYKYSNYRIIQHSMDFVSIYEIRTNTEVLSDFEYAKRIKFYERKMIEYEKLYNEYLIKKRRYPELHERYLKVHLSGELYKLESELDECLIQFSKLENEISLIKTKIEKAKKDLADVNSRNAVV
jgi:hypothetical protein